MYIYGTIFFEIIHQNYSLYPFYMVSEPNIDILYNTGSNVSLFAYMNKLISTLILKKNISIRIKHVLVLNFL